MSNQNERSSFLPNLNQQFFTYTPSLASPTSFLPNAKPSPTDLRHNWPNCDNSSLTRKRLQPNATESPPKKRFITEAQLRKEMGNLNLTATDNNNSGAKLSVKDSWDRYHELEEALTDTIDDDFDIAASESEGNRLEISEPFKQTLAKSADEILRSSALLPTVSNSLSYALVPYVPPEEKLLSVIKSLPLDARSKHTSQKDEKRNNDRTYPSSDYDEMEEDVNFDELLSVVPEEAEMDVA